MDTMTMGGAEKALVELLKVFDYDKYDVTLWLRDNSGELFSSVDSRVKISYWKQDNMRSNWLSELRRFHVFSFIKGLYYRVLSRINSNNYDKNAVYSYRCMDKIEQRYDCVVSYQILFPFTDTIALYHMQAPKKVLWVHGRNVLNKKNNKFFDRLYRKFNKIYCVSEKTREDFVHDFPHCKDIAQVCYNVFDAEDIIKRGSLEPDVQMCKSTVNIVSVGRLSSIKGHDRIPQIVERLTSNNYHVKWYIVGDGDNRAAVEELIREYDVMNDVILLGMKDNPYPYIRQCDIYVQPSYSEGYCTTTMEAKILHKPIVTTDVPGMREQFESGVNGLIVESSVDGLYSGIKKLLDEPELCESFVERLKGEKLDNSGELKKLYDFIEA